MAETKLTAIVSSIIDKVKESPMFVTRTVSALMLIFSLLTPQPTYAGTTSVADGKGIWQSTKCIAPKLPESLSNDPETPADELNDRMRAYNEYVAQVQGYMSCVSQEAKADADANNQIVIRTAQEIIQKTKEDLNNVKPRQKN